MSSAEQPRFRVRSPLLWLQVGCVAAFLCWAAVFELDVASHADGQVIPAGQTKRVQHLEGGIVRAIKVTEGQRVRQGEVIAELEGVASTADLGELRSRAGSLEGKAMRLNAILARKGSLALPAELEKSQPSVAADARSAFTAYRERYNAVVRTHESKIAQRSSEIEEARERMVGLQSRSRLIAEQVAISEQMLRQKLTNEYEHLQLRKEQAAIDADRDTTVATQQRHMARGKVDGGAEAFALHIGLATARNCRVDRADHLGPYEQPGALGVSRRQITALLKVCLLPFEEVVAHRG